MVLSTINNIIPNTHSTNNFQSGLASSIQYLLIHTIDWTKSKMQYDKRLIFCLGMCIVWIINITSWLLFL